MNKLDKLVSDIVFDAQEKMPFSSDEKANQFLIKMLEADGIIVNCFNQEGYFYCTMEMPERNLEVCADSRANVKPRNMKEAVCVAAIKLFIPDNKNSWNKLLSALDIDPTTLKT